MNPSFARLLSVAACFLLPGKPAAAAPVFSVPGFVDETLYTGAGIISMAFDPAGRLWACEKQGRVLVFPANDLPASSFNYSYYRNTSGTNWTVLPNFAALTPVKTGVVNSFTLDPREQEDQFAFVYTGPITTATAGSYTFYLSSDDGSRLFVDGALVVDHDGSHGSTEKSGAVTLTAGTHDLRVEYFENAGGQALDVQYSGPGVTKGPVAQGPFKAPVVVANYASQVNTDGERGMLGLVLDPAFSTNRQFYLLFSTDTDQRVLRLTANTDFNGVVAGSEVTLLSGLPNTNSVHKAGDMHFHPQDPDHLYVVLGDDGDRYIVGNLDLYNGKILRISSSDGKGVTGNPYYNGDANAVRSRVWAARFRNPYRFTFDPAETGNALYISENGDGTDRVARIEMGADGGWDNQFTTDSSDGKRRILETSDPSKTGIAIIRSGPFAPGGVPVLYNARYGGGDRNVVKRWQLTGTNGNTLTPLAADGGAAFYSGFTEHGIVSFMPGPDGSLYYSDSGQGSSTSGQRLGRIRFVGGVAPVASFTASATTGPAPLAVNFTDTSTSSGSTIASRAWDFGDQGSSTAVNPSHTFTQPGVYTVSLTVTDAQGLEETVEKTVTVYAETSIHLTGTLHDGRTLAAGALSGPSELRFYQSDGVTPLAVTGGTGSGGNIRSIPAGVIDLTVTARITGAGMVVSAGEGTGDGLQPAFVGAALSTTQASQTAAVDFYLSDTLLRGRVLDTRGAPARVDLGVSRGEAGNYYAVAGGRDFLAGAGRPASGKAHRVVADALGYYHVPILTGGGGAEFFLDTTADTLTATHGRVGAAVSVAQGAAVVKDLTIGLYDGGTGEADLSGIAVIPAVDFETQIQPIFTASCVACHNDIATNSGGLNLQPGAAFNELVGMLSTEAHGVQLVERGSAARSYLMEKINAAVPQVGTSMRPGDPMPLAQRALIRDWINQLSTAPGGFAAWQAAQFGTEAGSPEAQADADYDGDGKSNLIEYVLGTNPKASQPDSGYLVERNEAGRLQFAFHPAADLEGITLRIVATETLQPGDWQEIASKPGNGAWAAIEGASVISGPGEGEVTITDLEASSGLPRRFLRLEAVLEE